MTAPLGDKPATEKSPVNWYWVGALFAMAQLGVLLESAISPERIRFLGNPLTSIGIWGAVLCVLFKREKAKTGHPQQAGIVLAVDARGVATFTLLVGHLASTLRFGFSAVVNLIIGAIVFSLVLLLRYEYGIPLGTRSCFGKRCRICGAFLIYYYDLAITKDSKRPLATHCYFCGTNCEGPIEQPLTPTAQDVVDGKKVYREFGRSRVYIEPSKIPPDPIPFPYGEYFKQLPKMIGLIIAAVVAAPFVIVFLMGGPYLALKWILVLAGFAFFVFAGRSLFRKLKAPCPHCKANLYPLAYNSVILRRSLRYQQRDGHYVVEADPRYCPYCGKNIEEPAENH